MEKSQSAYREEQQQLTKIAAEINRQYDSLDDKDRYFGDNFTEQILDDLRQSSKNQLKIAREEPYFGRLDFQEEPQSDVNPIYIGKVGVSDHETGHILVVDWRAPIASLFYSFSGAEENIYYDSPDGTITGEIHLKRNIVIREQKLIRVVDAYKQGNDNLAITDEFLLYRLEENKDHRLRDIVSTIQSEQNSIIRAPRDKALIIQGVAGSGKTTVALHRLAFLIYQYRERIKAEKMIIFAPNSMFLDYISDVLPELGVGGIEQTTFSDWAISIINETLQIIDSHGLQERFGLGDFSAPTQALGRIKGAIVFREWLTECIKLYTADMIPHQDFEAAKGYVLTQHTIKGWFYHDYKHYPLRKRRQRIVNRIKRWIDIKQKDLLDTKMKKTFKQKANQRLRTYLKKWPDYSPLTFYKMLLSEPSYYNKLPNGLTTSILLNETLNHLKLNRITEYDLAPLVYLHNIFYGIEHKYHHIVIDEAQDISPFQVSVLKDMTLRNSFTILGDLSQGIHDYKGIHHWDELTYLFDSHFLYHKLEKSYRSTMEIIHFANAVLVNGYQPVHLAQPIFRSGDQVTLIESPENNYQKPIIAYVQYLMKKDIHSIAIISRDLEQSQMIYQHLKHTDIPCHLIDETQKKYHGGVSILPVYLAKGLEFDAVLLEGVTSINYTKSERDAKLLYVGCTRALHYLSLFYSHSCSPLVDMIDSNLYTFQTIR